MEDVEITPIGEGFTTASSSAFVPHDTSSPVFSVTEQFTCAMYDSTTQHSKVNDLRQELFPNRVTLMERLPPTQNALLQHVNRCLYQASIWLLLAEMVLVGTSQTMDGIPSGPRFQLLLWLVENS